jgi:hypothetical protein
MSVVKSEYLPLPVPQRACNKFHFASVESLSSPYTLQLNTALYKASIGLAGTCCCGWVNPAREQTNSENEKVY